MREESRARTLERRGERASDESCGERGRKHAVWTKTMSEFDLPLALYVSYW